MLHARVSTMAILAACACSSEPVKHELHWEIVFPADEPDLRERTARLIATISAGSCDGPVLYEARLLPDGTTRAPRPRPLPTGHYAFRARAFDSSCVELADGCIQTNVPLANGATLSIGLISHALPGTSNCPEECMLGACPVDAGPKMPMDAGLPDDGGTPDGPTGDAGGPMDAGPPDAPPDAPLCDSCCRADGDCGGSPCCDGYCGARSIVTDCPYPNQRTCTDSSCMETVDGPGLCVTCTNGSTCDYEYDGSGGVFVDCVDASACALDIMAGGCCVVYCGASTDCTGIDRDCSIIRI